MTAPSESEASRASRNDIADTRAKIGAAAQGAIERTKDGIDQTRGMVSDAYETGRDKAAEAYAAAREQARSAARSAGDGVDHNPIAALLGGLALGVALGALLPRTERERQVLGPVGEKLQDAAHEAVEAAKGAGRDKLAELGLTRDQARDTARSLFDNLIAAAGSAGAAAFDSARKSSR